MPVVNQSPSPFSPTAAPINVQAANLNLKAASGLEDIFSSSETAAKPSAFQPKTTAATDPYAGYNDIKEPKRLINKLFFLATLIISVALMGGGTYWAYNYFIASSKSSTEIEEVGDLADEQIKPVEIISNEETEKTEEPVAAENNNEETKPLESANAINPELIVPALSTKDTDQDGLNDQEELELGTNANSTDTDTDGLFDREEVRVYKTDPLKPDTDGDTFLDGAEVKSGYNPSGEGKLFNL